MDPAIIQGTDIVSFNATESQNLAVKPSVQHKNPLIPTASQQKMRLMKVLGNRHEYKMLHLHTPKYVLQPMSGCANFNPQTKTYMSPNQIVCKYFELNEMMCPDEWTEACLHNLSSRNADVEGVMLQSTQPISQITAAVIVALQTAIGSSIFAISEFGATDFNTGTHPLFGEMDLTKNNGPDEVTNFVNMMQQTEGFWTIIRRRVSNNRIKYRNTNDGTAGGNATLAANIKDFLQDMVTFSAPVLQFWRDITGVPPVFILQNGLFLAYKKYLQSLPGGEAAHMYIVDGFSPLHTIYRFDEYPVMRSTNWDLFDIQAGLVDEATGLSKVQRAIFTVPENLCLITNVREREGLEGGLQIQRSPLIREKGRTDMFMTLGIGAGIVHNELLTVGYNSSFTYATS